MSRSDFVDEFTDAVGTGVQEFVATRRVRFAERLLRSGEAPLQELAKRAGFRSDGAFRRAFAKVTGHTPSGNAATRARALLTTGG